MSFDMLSIPRIEFIGRQREIADHQQFLAKKTPWLFMMAGMPGIGKSTLLNYFDDHARETLYIKLDFANQLLTTDPLKILEELSWRLANYCDQQAVDTFDQELQAARSHFVQHGLQLVTNIRERILASKTVNRSNNFQQELELHIEYGQEDAIVEEQEQLRKVEEAFYGQMRTCTAKSLVLLFDTCEWLNRSEVHEQGEWFTDKLIPQLHRNLRCHIIIASRTYPKMKTITSQEQILYQLPMLDKSSVLTYLQDTIGVEDEKARTEIFTITHGHPLCLSIMIALWREKGEVGDVADSPLETEYNERTIVELVRERLDSHLKSPFREWTHYGVLFRLFNWELLRAIFPELETVANLYTCFEIFTTYSYIKDIGGGYYTIHELFREVLAENVRTQEYDIWKHYHQQALNYYANRADPEQYYHAFALDDRKGMLRWHERVQEAFHSNHDRAEIEQLLDSPKDSAFHLSAFGEGLYHYTWGLYESSRKQWPEASEQFRWTLEKFQEANESAYEALAHRSLGDIAAKDPDPNVRQQALASYEQASNIFSDLADAMNEALVLQAAGDVLQSNNQQQEALYSYKEALTLFRQVNTDTARKHEATVLQIIGTLKLQNKKLRSEALNDYLQAQRIFHDLHDPRGEAFNLLAIGNFRLLEQKTAYEQLKDSFLQLIAGSKPYWQEAIDDYQRALSLFDAIDNQQNAINALLSIGDTYCQHKQWRKALEQYETAIERYRQLDINTRNMLLADEALIYEKIGEMQEKLRKRQMAQESYQQSLALFAQVRDSNSEGRVLQLINNTQAFTWWRIRSFLRRPRYSILVMALIVLVILIISAPILHALLLPGGPIKAPICNLNQSPPNTIGITQTSPQCGAQSIGVSDGSYAFDAGQGNISDKDLAAQQQRAGNIAKAEQFWHQAYIETPSDAEVLIYAEDLLVMSSLQKYITIVVSTTLTPFNNIVRGGGRDILQGAYLAQKAHNEACRTTNQSCPLLRLLIANVGDNTNYVMFVARQIINIARKDPTIIGVTGFMTSENTLKALPILADAHIPLISSSATGDQLTDISPYFFRTVPADDSQAAFGALYAKSKLHKKRVAIFYDPHDAYSNSLASAFRLNFDPTGKQIIATEKYTVGARDGGPLINEVNSVIAMHPDLIYFAGYANDASILLTNTNIQNGSTLLMGGDALFVEGDYTITALNTTFQYLYFTSFAYINPPQNTSQEVFQQSYQAQFDPEQNHPQVFGYSQPDSVAILTNDAINVFIKGYQNALTNTKSSLITPNDIRIGLSQINSARPFSGVGGQIAFDKNGNPINKTIVMLHGDTINDLRIEACNTRSQCPKAYLEASV